MTLPDNWIDNGPQFHASDENAVEALVNANTLARLATSKLVNIGDNAYGTSLLANAASTVGTGEMMFTVGMAATNISAQWIHWYTQVASNPKTDTLPAGPITFNASLRVVSTSNPGTTVGTIYRLRFGARISATLDPGGSIVSDPLGISFAVGDKVAIRTFLVSGTAYAPRKTWGGFGTNNGGFTATTDLTAPGSAAVTAANTFAYGPASLLGRTSGASTPKSVLILGDSITFGLGDAGVLSTKPQIPGGGYPLRALSGVAGLINLSVGGDTIGYFQSTDGSYQRLTVAERCTSAIIEYGSNDLSIGTTAAQLEALILDIATKVQRLGISKVAVTTLIPRTTSTDDWATTIIQTPLSMESNRVAYNTWVRAGCPVDPTTKTAVAVGTAGALLAGSFGHPVTAFFDTASTVETSLNSGLWKPTGRTVTGSITSGQATLTSTDANFQSTSMESGGDLGSCFVLRGAAAAGADLTGAAIAVVTNSTTTTINALASTTVTNAVLYMGVKTVDGVHPTSDGDNLIVAAINIAML